MSCHRLVLTSFLLIALVNALSSVFLLERAYVARCESKLVLVGGGAVILSSVVLTLLQATSITGVHDVAGMCKPAVPVYTYYLRFVIDFVFSLVSFALFIHVTIQMYRRRRTNAWRKLAQNGIITMLLVCATHLVSMLCITVEPLSKEPAMFYLTDT
ncbi:hypothetical protein SYNPS1DRAFT_21602 [Syncephalis pseudoplumigaleata]|uniref:Uncharacterized protein n=1 Tax=Syncephalis pseudoplumigaleata TaxID=1712513 RepID=A0A4P9Z2T1_9FUNG|nr:hypothetical protein SYNPS1DRAFT_21602 [Syncephalis pseudoplumigaleata]|eukprot:RKP26685.1 hypothetical protein SYNPS1DRAFT_21602 [Syncephalis pseudoplumigaleata]